MGDRYPNLSLDTSCTYAPTYGRCDVGGAYAWGKGKKKLTLDVNAHHEESFDGMGIATTGLDVGLTSKKWFLNLLVRHVNHDNSALHTQSGAVEFGVGAGGRWKKPFKKYFSLDHLVAGGLILQDQLVGNLSRYGRRSENTPDSDGGLFFWPIITAKQALSFKTKWLTARLSHGINLFSQVRQHFLKTDSHAFLPDWNAGADIVFKPSHFWRKQSSLDMSFRIGARYLSGWVLGGLGENAEMLFGVNLGQKTRKFRWQLSAEYIHPIRRDLHAADALPEGRLQMLRADAAMIWQPTARQSLLLGAGFATHMEDRDASWLISPPIRDYVYGHIGYRYGPLSVFGQVMAMPKAGGADIIAKLGLSLRFGTSGGRSIPLELIKRSLPNQHLPSASREGVNGLKHMAVGGAAVGLEDSPYADRRQFARALARMFLGEGNTPKRDDSTGPTELVFWGSDGTRYVINTPKIYKDIDSILKLNITGAQKAQRLIMLGKSMSTEVEKVFIIAYVIAQYTTYNSSRRDHPMDPKNWNMWSLAKVLDEKKRVCRDASYAAYQYFLAVGISRNRLKLARVGTQHMVLFYQIKGGPNDGYWVAYDQRFVSSPIMTRDVRKAIAWYSPHSYGRGWTEPGKGPFGTPRARMGFTGQFQRMRKAARRLVTPRR